MRARVSIWTIDGEPLESQVVDDPTDEGDWIRVLAGPRGQEGEESFDLLVCTPKWLARVVDQQGPQVGRHRLIVGRWDVAQIKSVVTDLFERESGENWDELATRLARIGHWEFEDYGEPSAGR